MSLEVLSLQTYRSYQVPKEVGKVGTESPTFIEPIAQRKDGIQAMFAKQKGSSAQTTKPTKRKRSKSPPVQIESDDSDVQIIEPSTSQRSAKSQKMNTWEDDSDVEYVDKPPSQSKPSQSGSSGRKTSVSDVISAYTHS